MVLGGGANSRSLSSDTEHTISPTCGDIVDTKSSSSRERERYRARQYIALPADTERAASRLAYQLAVREHIRLVRGRRDRDSAVRRVLAAPALSHAVRVQELAPHAHAVDVQFRASRKGP